LEKKTHFSQREPRSKDSRERNDNGRGKVRQAERIADGRSGEEVTQKPKAGTGRFCELFRRTMGRFAAKKVRANKGRESGAARKKGIARKKRHQAPASEEAKNIA